MAKLSIIAHGGAGADPMKKSNVEEAIQKGFSLLESDACAVDAAVEACVILENDPAFNAGTGSVTRLDGSVLVDASIHVNDGRLGFVASMPETPNPIRVAQALLDAEINGLGGIGAREWADQRGIPRSVVTPRPPGKTASGDTVGVIAMDSEGVMATATSTGGCSDQPAGRIGDVPLPGCGFWVESGVAVAATGIGEAITREMLSHRVHGWISRDGIPMGSAFEKAIKTRFEESTDVGLIGMTSDGSCVARANTNMPWASWNSDGIRG